MAYGTGLDRANRSKVQYGSGAPSSSTRGNLYIDNTNGTLYFKYGSTWQDISATGSYYLQIDGETTQYTNYCLLYEGSGISLVEGANGIEIVNTGVLTQYELEAHADTHENGGSDEINVVGLSGILADNQHAGWLHNISIASTTPTNGQVLRYNSSLTRWEPGAGSSYDDSNVFYHDGSRTATGDFDLGEFDIEGVSEIRAETSSETLTIVGGSSTTDQGIIVLSESGVALYSSQDSGSTNYGIKIDLHGISNFSDIYYGTSTWTSPMPFSASQTEWDSARTILGDTNGSLLGLILTASGASPVLTESYIGYGSDTNTLTGSDTLTYDSTNRWVLIGAGTPTSFATEEDYDSLYIDGQLEVNESSLFNNIASHNSSLWMNGNSQINLGSGTSTAGRIYYSSTQTVPSLMLLSDTTSKNIILSSVGNEGNFNHSAQTNPTLWIHSASTPVAQYLKLLHNQTDAEIKSGRGSIVLKDEHMDTSDWNSSTGLSIASSSSEWSDAYSLLGDTEGSLLALILAASTGGTSLDDAYDFTGSGAGKSITADAGAVSIVTGGSNSCLALTNLSSGFSTEMCNIYNSSTDTDSNAIYFDGDRGSADTYGHKLWTEDSISIGREGGSGDAAVSYNYCRLSRALIVAESTAQISSRLHVYGSGYTSGIVAYTTGPGTTWGNATYTSARLDLYADTSINFDSPYINIDATDTVAIEGTSAISLDSVFISCEETPIINLLNATYGNTPQTITYSSSISVDWEHDVPLQICTMTGNISSVTFSNAPYGIGGGFQIVFIASGGSRTISSGAFPGSITWMGNYDLSSESVTIPSGSRAVASFMYLGSTYNYVATFIGEKDDIPVV